jgi:hypothetical protein
MSTEKINIDIKSVISDFENLKNETTALATSLTQIAKSTKQLDSALTTIAGKQDFTKSLDRIKKINTELLGIQKQAISNKLQEQKILELQIKNEEKKLKITQKQNDEQKKELGAFDQLKQKLQEVEKESKDLLAVINQTKNVDKETIALYEKKVKDARELRNAIKDINNEHRTTRDIYKENINNQIKINKDLEAQKKNKEKQIAQEQKLNELQQKQESNNLHKARGSQLTKENLQAQEQERYNKKLKETITLNAKVEKQLQAINTQTKATSNLTNKAGALGLSSANIDKVNKLNTELLELQNRLEKLRNENKLNTNQYTKASADLDVLTQKIKDNNREVGEQIKLANQRDKQTAKDNKQNEPYQRLSNELGKLRKEAKNVQAEMFLLERSGQKTSKAYKDLEARSKTLTTQTKTLDSSIKKIDGSLGLHQRNVGNYGSALNGIGRELLGAFGIATGIQLFADVVMGASKIVLDFYKKQSELQAILGVSSEATASLTAKTLQLGSSTVFTATQVTEAGIELAKMGFNLKEVEDSLEGVLNGAVAMGTTIQNSAKLSATTLKAFGLEAKEAERVTSVLALSTARSATDFEYLNVALPYAGQGAKSLGISIEELTAMLGVLADRGLQASTAGTSLRDIFTKLETKGGNLTEVLDEINNSADKTNTALKFSDETSINALKILSENRDAIDFQTKAITGQEEAMKRMADVRLDNLAGDITLMSSAWEGFVLSIEQGNGIISTSLRNNIQIFTDFLKLITTAPNQAEVLSNELITINSLASQITNLNEQNETRAGLLLELNQQYPNLLKGLNLEKLSNKDLSDIIQDVNSDYLKRIQNEVLYAEKTKLTAEKIELVKRQEKERLKIFQELSNVAIENGIDPSTIIDINNLSNSYDRLSERIGFLNTIIIKFKKAMKDAFSNTYTFSLPEIFANVSQGTSDFIFGDYLKGLDNIDVKVKDIDKEIGKQNEHIDNATKSQKGLNSELSKTKKLILDNASANTTFANGLESARQKAIEQDQKYFAVKKAVYNKGTKEILRTENEIYNVETGKRDKAEEQRRKKITADLKATLKADPKAIKFRSSGNTYSVANPLKRIDAPPSAEELKKIEEAKRREEQYQKKLQQDRERAEQERIRRQEEYNRQLLAEKQLNIDILQLRMDMSEITFKQTDDERTINDNLQFAQSFKLLADEKARLESDKSITDVGQRKDMSSSERAKELEKIDLDLKLKLKENEVKLEESKKQIMEDGLRYKENVAKNELEIFKLNNNSKIIDEQYLTDEVLRIETERLKSIAELEKKVVRKKAGFDEKEADRILANKETEKIETVNKAIELKSDLQKIDEDLIKEQINNIDRLDKIKEEAFERDIQRTERLYQARIENELRFLDKVQQISEARIDDEWDKMDSALEREKERKLDNEWLTDRGKEDIEKEFDEKSRKLAEDRENQKLVVQQQAEQKRIQIEFDRQMREYDMLQLSFNREKEKEKRAIKNAELQLDLQEQLALAGAKDDEERKKIAKSFADSRSKIAEATRDTLRRIDKEYSKDFKTIEDLRTEASKQRFIDTLQTGDEFTNKMSSLFAGMYSLINTLDNSVFEERKERIEEETGMTQEYAENVLNNKLVYQEKEVEDAEKAKQYYIKNEEDKTRATINGIAIMSGVVADFFGRQTAAGKAFAVAQATMNTYLAFTNALANTPGPPPIPQIAAGLVLASGLLQVAKIVSTEPPKFADGTLYAPETRQSITDEEGSELHFDKNWRLRDVGKESGKRMKMVYKGDKIIPADTSKIIKQIMINNAIQNKEESFKFDYDLFANKTAKAINNKSNSAFLLDNGKILKISEKNGRITIDATELNKKEYGNQRLVK